MAFRPVHSWTLATLILAFVDLAIAYVLLCGSASAFLLSKFLSAFGLYLPCPCSGILGYQNNDLCLHKLVIDWPRSKINYVQDLVKSRFPFDLVWFRAQSSDLHVEGVRDRKRENEVIELEGEGCSSSFSGPRLFSSVDGESGYDTKRKKVTNQKLRSGIRRRRRTALGYGKFPSALSPKSTGSVGLGVPHSYHDSGGEMRSQISENLGPASGTEDGLLDDGHALNSIDNGERVHSSFELNGSYDKGKGIRNDPSSVGDIACNIEDTSNSIGNDANAIKMLEQAFEEEKAALAALHQDLEKERAAAASAADEAMAMIMRLQEDKASIEMEARQYQRMIEEKFAYDEEEMTILKELIVRRERENHFLEKELEAYRLMNTSGKEKLEDGSRYKPNNTGKRPLLSLDSNETLLLLQQQVGKTKTIFQNEVETNTNCSSNHEHSHTFSFGKEMMPELKESASNSSTLQEVLQKTPSLAEKEKPQREISMISQTCGGVGEELGKDRNHLNQPGSYMHSPVLDTELIVYDVHVLDDKSTVWKEDGGKESGPLSNAPSDFGVWTTSELSEFPSISETEIEPNAHGSHLDTASSSPGLGNSQCKTLDIDSQQNSSSAVNSERLKIDSEVEWLRERLQAVQEEKEKLTFSAEHKRRVSVQLKHVEEIVSQLQEIYQLREPLQQASLPVSSSKVC
ncbi:unnamed protein product [Dovyalis caffra]|uniref:GTD-binding domain-containing protein n=1 Tax=Dovyalis caffra TaxID=77055 RepID=A0AAV1RH69_9ROSI|nr:unnamed protein product [Dovyalis caffra]